MFQIVTNLIAPRALFSPVLLPQKQIRIGPDELYQRYGHSKLCKTADSRDLGFGPTGSSAIRSADLENPTLEPKMKRIRLFGHWPFEIFQNGGQPPSWIWCNRK